MTRLKYRAVQLTLLVIAVFIYANPAVATDYPAVVATDYSGLQWSPEEGGCRTSDDRHGTYKLYEGVSLDECKSKCGSSENGSAACTAIEYNPTKRGCEVHKEPIAKATGPSSYGTNCYIVDPEE